MMLHTHNGNQQPLTYFLALQAKNAIVLFACFVIIGAITGVLLLAGLAGWLAAWAQVVVVGGGGVGVGVVRL